ncbi:terpene cyclase [Pichia californica]|uniref:Terpene cyclase/mutase family member n=1 Tax=Pichia californica TaxID=460514 RepID=A0A9P7BGB4_9ASCO|nr:terpene cyclase [[Candida] californica]KAG0689000.1 terpene cyclase [[Candida] californica]
MQYSDTIDIPKTDFSKWRLRTTELGAQRWEYLQYDIECVKDPQDNMTKYLLNQSDFTPPSIIENPKTVFEAAKNGASFFQAIQDEKSGTWPVQYKGPMFMTIGYIACCYFTKISIPDYEKKELIRYIVNTAHPVDGGWGLHEIDKSTCFGTTINYVILRILGLPKEHPVCTKARKTLHKLGGAIGNPHWGKAWLSVLNLYKWEGVNPAPTELFALPYWVPIHPMKWWVHTRAIYIPLGYLSSAKVQCELDPLLQEIRSEIFTKPFDSIEFTENRNKVCGVDLYYPHTSLLNILNKCMVIYETYVRPNWVLNYCNQKAYDLILKELENTEYLGIAPVSAAFETIVLYHKQGKDGKDFKRSFERMKEVMFLGKQGMTVMGTNGSQVWDCAFFIQYFFNAGLAELPQYHNAIVNSFKFLIRSQFDTECVQGSFRDKRLGAWPFSTKEQGYTVSDCTAESIKAIIMVMNSKAYSDVHELYDTTKLHNAIDVLLSLQNVGNFEFGSFSTYERIKATPLLELINPAEVFGNIMVEYPYVECTDSSVLGLAYFTKYSNYRSDDIKIAIQRATDYIKKSQQIDGSWYGCWGICFTYAGMFALEALADINLKYNNSDVVKKGCDFLVSRQLDDGGWGESMKSSETHTYVTTCESLAVQTAWAVIGLLLANYPDKDIIRKGIDLIIKRQKETGEWEFENIEGVFNHSCAIEYPNYKFLFPIKALGLYVKRYGNEKI